MANILDILWVNKQEPRNHSYLWIKPTEDGKYEINIWGTNGWTLATSASDIKNIDGLEEILNSKQNFYNCALEDIENPQLGDICVTPEKKDEIPLVDTGSSFSGTTLTFSNPCTILIKRTSVPLSLDGSVSVQENYITSKQLYSKYISVITSDIVELPQDTTNASMYITFYGRVDNISNYIKVYDYVPSVSYIRAENEWIPINSFEILKSGQKVLTGEWVVSGTSWDMYIWKTYQTYGVSLPTALNSGDLVYIPKQEIDTDFNPDADFVIKYKKQVTSGATYTKLYLRDSYNLANKYEISATLFGITIQDLDTGTNIGYMYSVGSQAVVKNYTAGPVGTGTSLFCVEDSAGEGVISIFDVISVSMVLPAKEYEAYWDTSADTPTIKTRDRNATERTSNKVTSLSASSTDEEYPSAKCVYDIVGNIESLLDSI